MLYHAASIDEIFRALDTTEKGLYPAEVERRLRRYGRNEIHTLEKPRVFSLADPISAIYLLIIAGMSVVAFILGNAVEGIVILGFIILIAAVLYKQASLVRRLRNNLHMQKFQTTEVIRNGKIKSVDSSELVPGDIILINEGDYIPADARIITSTALSVTHPNHKDSLATTVKRGDIVSSDVKLDELSNMIFRGSLAVSGYGIGIITATGNNTRFKTSSNLNSVNSTANRIQLQIGVFVLRLVIATVIMTSLLLLIPIGRGLPVSEAIVYVISFALSVIPIGLPIVVSAILSLAVGQIAKRKALIRDHITLEKLSTVNVIFTDSTAILTRNRPSIKEVWQPEWSSIDLKRTMALAINVRHEKYVDTVDTAFMRYLGSNKQISTKRIPFSVFPFDPNIALSGNIWHSGNEFELAVKGAPEAVLARSDLTDTEREHAMLRLNRIAAEGYHVFAVGYKKIPQALRSLNDLRESNSLEFAGFVAMIDPLHPEAKKTVKEVSLSGIFVKLITSDYAETAHHVGSKIGLISNRRQVYDCRQMHIMDDGQLSETIKDAQVFARPTPDQKQQLLQLLKKSSVVLSTGSKVTDISALTSSDVSVALSIGPSGVHKVSDVILLDDNLKTIHSVINAARNAIQNVRRTVDFLMTINFGIALTIVVALIIGLPLPMLPIQVLWAHLIISVLLAIPLGTESHEKTSLIDLPLPVNSPLFDRYRVSRLIVSSTSMAVITLGYYIAFSNIYDVEYGRTIAFNTTIAMMWAIALSARGFYESIFERLKVMNIFFYRRLFVGVLLHVITLLTSIGTVLHLDSVNIGDVFATGFIAFTLMLLILELHKVIGRIIALR